MGAISSSFTGIDPTNPHATAENLGQQMANRFGFESMGDMQNYIYTAKQQYDNMNQMMGRMYRVGAPVLNRIGLMAPSLEGLTPQQLQVMEQYAAHRTGGVFSQLAEQEQKNMLRGIYQQVLADHYRSAG